MRSADGRERFSRQIEASHSDPCLPGRRRRQWEDGRNQRPIIDLDVILIIRICHETGITDLQIILTALFKAVTQTRIGGKAVVRSGQRRSKLVMEKDNQIGNMVSTAQHPRKPHRHDVEGQLLSRLDLEFEPVGICALVAFASPQTR